MTSERNENHEGMTGVGNGCSSDDCKHSDLVTDPETGQVIKVELASTREHHR